MTARIASIVVAAGTASADDLDVDLDVEPAPCPVGRDGRQAHPAGEGETGAIGD